MRYGCESLARTKNIYMYMAASKLGLISDVRMNFPSKITRGAYMSKQSEM